MSSGDLFRTAPSVHPSFQGICHKSDGCLRTPAGRHCRNDLSARCVRKGACCTERAKKENQKQICEYDAGYLWFVHFDSEV